MASHINSNDTAHAISYIRDFSEQAKYYKNNKCDEALALLNRCASLLCTAVQPQYFTPGSLEISRFFVDLHTVMATLSVDSDALWACIALLQHCSRNVNAHKAISEEFRFIPLLTFILKRVQPGDRQYRLLTLIQELTFGIHIKHEEPYVAVLLEHLVNIIYAAGDGAEEKHAELALSILINLCYKNFVVMFLFLRSVNISTFSRHIQNYGILANKMLIILSEDIHSPSQTELKLFLRSSFVSIVACIKNLNIPHLRHIVDFLKDSKSHSGLFQAMLAYEHCNEDIGQLLDCMKTCCSSKNDVTEDTRKQMLICLNLVLELIQYIAELSTWNDRCNVADHKEVSISLESISQRIYELLSSYLDSDICGINALDLLITLVQIDKKESIVQRIASEPSIVVDLIAGCEKPDASSLHTAAVLRLLTALLHQTKTEKLIICKSTESFFNKVLSPLLIVEIGISEKCLSLEDIHKYVYCLLLFINFVDIAKKTYFEKFWALLQRPQVQYALARAMLQGDTELCKAVLRISQFQHFPREKMAKHISHLNRSNSALSANYPTEEEEDKWRNLNAILKSHCTFISKEVEERVQSLVDIITKACETNQMGNISTSQIIELFNYKIEKFITAEKNMQERLEQTSQQITHLTQRISLQNAELEKYHTDNFELHVEKDSLQTQCYDLKCQKQSLKRNINSLMKKISEQSDNLEINEKRLSDKVSEYTVLQKEHNALKEQLSSNLDELEKLRMTSKENLSRIEKLKKTIAVYELDLKEKIRNLEEKEKELTRTQKSLEEQREAKKKSDDVIGILETQLADKNEQIRNYELELSETEELRKTIMCLMESKKPKRKV